MACEVVEDIVSDDGEEEAAEAECGLPDATAAQTEEMILSDDEEAPVGAADLPMEAAVEEPEPAGAAPPDLGPVELEDSDEELLAAPAPAVAAAAAPPVSVAAAAAEASSDDECVAAVAPLACGLAAVPAATQPTETTAPADSSDEELNLQSLAAPTARSSEASAAPATQAAGTTGGAKRAAPGVAGTPAEQKVKVEDDAAGNAAKADGGSKSKEGAKKPGAKDVGPVKEKKLTKDEMEAKVLDYMQTQNRPYNVQNVFDNLHGIVPKAQVQTILDTLVSNGKVVMKEYGKLKIYLTAQTAGAQGDAEEESQALEAEVKAAEGSRAQVQGEVDAALGRVRGLRRDREVFTQAAAVDQEVSEFQAKLDVLQKAAETCGEQVDVAELGAVEKDSVAVHREWKRRKRLCMEVLHMLSEKADMKVDKVIDRYAIDTDEACDQRFPDNVVV